MISLVVKTLPNPQLSWEEKSLACDSTIGSEPLSVDMNRME